MPLAIKLTFFCCLIDGNIHLDRPRLSKLGPCPKEENELLPQTRKLSLAGIAQTAVESYLHVDKVLPDTD